MKTIKTLGLALLAVAALGAVSVEAASAHQWKEAGAPLWRTEPIVVKSAVEFTVSKSMWSFNPVFECKYNAEGNVGSEGATEITKVTNVSGGAKIECRVIYPSEAGYQSITLEPEHLPWKAHLATFGTNEVQLVFNNGSTKWSETASAWAIGSHSIFGNEVNHCVLPSERLRKGTVGDVEAFTLREETETQCVPAEWSAIRFHGIEDIKLTSQAALSFE